jgi:hypothetical protein
MLLEGRITWGILPVYETRARSGASSMTADVRVNNLDTFGVYSTVGGVRTVSNGELFLVTTAGAAFEDEIIVDANDEPYRTLLLDGYEPSSSKSPAKVSSKFQSFSIIKGKH